MKWKNRPHIQALFGIAFWNSFINRAVPKRHFTNGFMHEAPREARNKITLSKRSKKNTSFTSSIHSLKIGINSFAKYFSKWLQFHQRSWSCFRSRSHAKRDIRYVVARFIWCVCKDPLCVARYALQCEWLARELRKGKERGLLLFYFCFWVYLLKSMTSF